MIVFNLHDEITVEVKLNEQDEVSKIVVECMEEAFK
jgi:DNA polymerase I-like protein with 3'-5' exonuclease and polymerase domains